MYFLLISIQSLDQFSFFNRWMLSIQSRLVVLFQFATIQEFKHIINSYRKLNLIRYFKICPWIHQNVYYCLYNNQNGSFSLTSSHILQESSLTFRRQTFTLKHFFWRRIVNDITSSYLKSASHKPGRARSSYFTDSEDRSNHHSHWVLK